MATIENLYTGDGSTVLFSFTFEYIEEVDVEVSIDSVTIATTEYSLANSTTIEFNTAPASGAEVRIYRNTTVDTPKATFFPGSAIRAQDLNDNFEQILFVTQEADAISERAELAADQAQIATTAALAASDTATAAATSAQSAASTAQTQVTAAQSAAASSAADANTAITTADAAVATANTANITSTAAAANAAGAATSASNAASEASAAQASAASAQSSATNATSLAASAQSSALSAQTSANNAATSAAQAATDAATALSTANSANSTAGNAATDASTALTTANNAVSTANAATATATTASSNAASAVTVANQASVTSQNATNTADTAVTTANGAVTTANTALADAATAISTANSAVTTANGAVTSANNAVTTANDAETKADAAVSAVSDAYLFTVVANVAAIPSSPSEGDAVRVADSTGVENISGIQNVLSGFVGDSGINAEIIFTSGNWVFLEYTANDPDDRYGYPPFVDVTRQNTVDAATLSGVALNSTDLGTFTGSTISDASTIKNALQSLETEVETKADLVGGVVPTSQLPALAVTEFLGTVVDQTTMLALTGQRGDFAIRSDTGTTFVLTSDGGSSLSHWQELATPTDAIQTVNGQAGTVVLGPSDVGAVSAASGGTFSGNVEIGTGIDLNTNGSASFAGSIEAVLNSTYKSVIANNGTIALYGANGLGVYLDNDGSADFAGTVKSSATANTFAALNDGYIVVQNPGGQSDDLLFRGRTAAGSEVVEMFADGSAEFASTVVIAPDNGRQIELANSPAGGFLYLREDDGTRNILLNGSDGSATFGGDLTAANDKVKLATGSGHGYIQVKNSSGTNNITLLGSDGSATFAGAVETSGKFESDRTVASHTVLRGALNGSQTSLISADGSASFAGDVTFSGGLGAITLPAGSDIRAATGGWTGEAPSNPGKLQYHDNHWYFQGQNSWHFRNGAGNNKLSIDSAGNLLADGNVTAYSDIRLKKDIEVIPCALDKVLSLRGVTFTDIESDDRRTGVIAQDVQAVLPEAVKEGEEYLSVAYGNLVGLLIESIKELEARVSELELL